MINPRKGSTRSKYYAKIVPKVRSAVGYSLLSRKIILSFRKIRTIRPDWIQEAMQKSAQPLAKSMNELPMLFGKVLRKNFACSNRRLRLSCEILLLARRRVGLGTIAINAASLQKTKKLKSMESFKKSRLDTKALHDRCMGNIHFAEELLKAYFETVQSDLAAFDKALARGDLLRIASMAHRIKRCSNKVGATADSIAAEKIEICCRSGHLEQLPLEIDAFRQIHLQTNSQWIIGNESLSSLPIDNFAAT